MHKIFVQWAVIGILGLMGWGVDLIPNNTSWVPSIVIWSFAFIWLLATVIYYFKRRQTPTYKDGIQPIVKAKDDFADIQVKAETYYSDKAVLEVYNKGAGATFTAAARVVRGNIESNLFNMRWKYHPNDTTCSINHGDTQTILFAEISPNTELNDEVRTTVFKGGIALYQAGGKRIGVSVYQVVEDAKLKRRYPTMYGVSKLIDECEIEVTITSQPQLLKPFNKQRYLVKIDHENNDKLTIASLSDSDKEDSQT